MTSKPYKTHLTICTNSGTTLYRNTRLLKCGESIALCRICGRYPRLTPTGTLSRHERHKPESDFITDLQRRILFDHAVGMTRTELAKKYGIEPKTLRALLARMRQRVNAKTETHALLKLIAYNELTIQEIKRLIKQAEDNER